MRTAILKKSNMNMKKLLVLHGLAFILLLFIAFIYRCPINYFFGIPCLGCGITRAHFAAASLDVGSAFRYHPLFFTVVPTLVYIAYRNFFQKRLSNKAETVIFSILLVLFFAVYSIRALSSNILFSV